MTVPVAGIGHGPESVDVVTVGASLPSASRLSGHWWRAARRRLRDAGRACGHCVRDVGVTACVRRHDGMLHDIFDPRAVPSTAQAVIDESGARFGELLRR